MTEGILLGISVACLIGLVEIWRDGWRVWLLERSPWDVEGVDP